ncbi:MAG TPA: protein-disulfide reductase DsbD domain-containing protein [Bryobacteraceae bacterium]|nr:protein-disulfide reductase DsbD domain-containing protein [Bryobacteraceae bacterium]
MVVCLPLLRPQSSERVSVGQVQKVSGKRNAAVTTHIPVSILDGYHVNSNAPADEYLIPLKVTWTSLGALEGGQVTFPKAEKITVGDQTLSVFTGKIDLGVNFKISSKAPAGPGIATGKLGFQACNNKMCFPPKSVEFNVPYQVQ